MDIDKIISDLTESGNLRRVPADTTGSSAVDLSTNDYLGIAADEALRSEFFSLHDPRELLMSASASRLLAAPQRAADEFEQSVADAYGRAVLTFNSGWHANTGMLAALASRSTLVVADRLVHASIIDGIRLSGAAFKRFRHNDYDDLERILEHERGRYFDTLIVAESVYSMDGDSADIARLADIRRRTPGAMLYVDEAHAVGVCGPQGLGLSMASGCAADVDIMVGTLGKAYGSTGAYAVMDSKLRQFMVNKARSFIFSTALPPVCMMWSRFTFEKSLGMDSRREHLTALAKALSPQGRYILPVMIGDPVRAIEASQRLLESGFKVMPIRTPTVPPGTDRLRISLTADLDTATILRLKTALNELDIH